jgi:hypothetical protein
VSGGDALGVQAACAVQERRELEVAVAVRAGQRCPARGIFAHEVRDDGLLKLPLEIHDVVRNAHGVRDAAGVVQVVEGAAAAETFAPAVIVELHRQSNDVMTLLDEQTCSHG